jgi:electron transfer flavoprotein alpha subunit
MTALVVAEHDNRNLNGATLNCVSAAMKLCSDIHILVAGYDSRAVAEQAAGVAGVATVRWADCEHYGHSLAENLAPLVVELAGRYSHILLPATSTGKNLAPRVAALLDVAPLSEVISVESADTFVRTIYAGNVLTTVQSTDAIKVITVRSTGFEAAAAHGGSAAIEAVEAAAKDEGAKFVSQELTRSERPELSAARRVVAGGRGMGSADNFRLLEQIADKLGAAVGASRAAVDAGYVTNSYQVGQTGKIIAPDLYIAVGISGAVQHLAGMKDSKVIVAINKDEEAPIFQVADYGLVGDLFQVLPELTRALDKFEPS